MRKDYYLILGVPVDATPDQLRKAFREKAKRFHPDHYGEDAAPFLDIQEAFSVLSNPDRRAAYDRSLLRKRRAIQGAELLRPERPPAEPLIPGSKPIELGDVYVGQSFQTFHPSFEEIFERLWHNFTGMTRPKAEGLEGLTIDVPLSREQAFIGGHVRVMVPALIVCPVCRGRGGVGFFECVRCGGEGQIAGDYPMGVAFPAGLSEDYAVSVPLDGFGIHNLYLIIRFRITRS